MNRASWQKSSFSGPDDNPDCVELRGFDGAVAIRESDNPGDVVTVPAPRVRALIASVKAGSIQHPSD